MSPVQPPERSSFGALRVAPSAFFATAFLVGAWRAFERARVEAWLTTDAGEGTSLPFLAAAHWAEQWRWKEGLCGAALAVALAAIGAALGRSSSMKGAGRFLAAATRVSAGVPFLLLTAFLALALPRLARQALEPEAPAGSPNVFFVMVDTWRADHAGFLGYERDVTPELDALVERGVVFERALSQAPWTKPSVATMFTGVMPSVHGAITQASARKGLRGTALRRDLLTIFEVLAASGWQTALWANNPNILAKHGFDQGVEHFVDHAPRRLREMTDDPGTIERVVPEVEAWLESERDATRPFCVYLHAMEPHYPYDPLPEFSGTFADPEIDYYFDGMLCQEFLDGRRDVAELSDETRRYLVDRYDEEILSLDAVLGPFLERLMERHPDTVVVVSDHGEEFFDHGMIGHAHSVYQELMHVPLVLWGPGLGPGRVSTQVRLLDLYPTILELTGAAVPAGQAGESLAGLVGADADDRPAPMESGGDRFPPWNWRGLSDGEWKWIRREEDSGDVGPLFRGGLPYDELYLLPSDPGETQDLHAEHTDTAAALFERMQKRGWYVTPERAIGVAAESDGLLGKDEADVMRALGYGGDE